MENSLPKSPKGRKRPLAPRNFPIRIACTIRAYRAGELIQEISGETVEISSSVVKVRTSQFVTNRTMEVSVYVLWPVTLEDGTALQLVFSGVPIWDEGVLGGIAIQRYQFRTRAAAAQRPAVSERVQAFPAAPRPMPYPMPPMVRRAGVTAVM